MNSPILKWSKENSYDLFFKFILFGISPFLGFIYALKNINTKSSYLILFLTGIFFGMAFTVGYDSTLDSSRHRVYFERDFLINWSEYLNTVEDYFSFSGTNKDLFRDSISFFISRFTNNYHWYFLAIAAIYGFFSLKSLRYLTSYKNYNFSILFLLLTYLFLIGDIFNINGVRFWTAGWISIYSIFQIFYSNNKKYIFLLVIAPLVHISFFVIVILAIIALLYQNIFYSKSNNKLLYIVYMFSFLFSVFSVSILQGVVDLLPPILQKLIASYTDQEYIAETNDFNATMTGMYFKIAKQVYINLMIVLLIKNRGFIKKNIEASRLFVFLLMLVSFVNIFMFIPSLGERFFLISFPIIAFLWALSFKGRRYNYVIYLIPLIFIRDLYSSFNHFREVLVLSDLYSSPIYLIDKYLISYSLYL